MDLHTFSARLRYFRRKAKLTQEEAADRAGLSREYVARLEGGRQDPSLSTLSVLAAALGIGPEDFFKKTADSS